MSDLDFNAFSKKYSLAISDLGKRLPSKDAKANLARALYSDALNNKINMDQLTTDVKLFYQGNTLGQFKLSQYVERYK